MPLQRIPPREGLHATSNHQPTSKVVRSSFDALFVGHTQSDTLSIQMRPTHPNTTAYPLLRLPPTSVSFNVALEVWNPSVTLDVVASGDRATEVGFLFDEQGDIFALEITRWEITLVRVRTPASPRGGGALLGFGGGGGRREVYATRS